jgi:hypothetical protein
MLLDSILNILYFLEELHGQKSSAQLFDNGNLVLDSGVHKTADGADRHSCPRCESLQKPLLLDRAYYFLHFDHAFGYFKTRGELIGDEGNTGFSLSAERARSLGSPRAESDHHFLELLPRLFIFLEILDIPSPSLFFK